MTPKAKKALAGSIRKWEGIVAGDTESLGDQNCPLCKLYNTDDGCDGCPVKASTGKDWCSGSPHTYWLRVTRNNPHGYAQTPLERRAALKMLRFLESLQ